MAQGRQNNVTYYVVLLHIQFILELMCVGATTKDELASEDHNTVSTCPSKTLRLNACSFCSRQSSRNM